MSSLALVILLSIIAATALAAGLFLLRSMFMATRGKQLAPYPTPRTALIVLDLQEGFAPGGTRPPVTHVPAGGLFATVNRLIEHAEATGMEVAYVRQVFGSNLLVRLHGGRRQGKVVIDRRIKVINGNDFEKNRTDAFSNREFERFLIDRQVDELYLVGVDAAYCVYYTALGALQRGYRVTVVTDAVRSRQEMAGVVKRYRQTQISTATSREVLTADEWDER